jgi:hypothetical protein
LKGDENFLLINIKNPTSTLTLMGTACMETFMVIIKHKFEAELEPVEKCKKTFAQKPASNFAFFDTNTAFLKKKKQFFDLLALFTDFEGKSG